MTTTDPKLIERIAEAMRAYVKRAGIVPTYEDYATAILPIVAAAINEAAQKERAGTTDDLLEWFGTRYGLELSFSGWDDENEWQVHIVNGGRNDREWTLLASGQSPAEAIANARAAMESQHKAVRAAIEAKESQHG